MTKRMTKEDAKAKLQENSNEEQRKAFWKEIVEVEQKHGRQIRAMLNYNHQGLLPYLQDVEHKHEETTPETRQDVK